MGSVVIDWQKPTLWAPEISKTGTFDKSDQIITWTIQVGPEGLDLSGAAITDKLADELTFVSGSATLNEEALDDKDVYNEETRTVSHTFGEGISGKQTLLPCKTKKTQRR